MLGGWRTARGLLSPSPRFASPDAPHPSAPRFPCRLRAWNPHSPPCRFRCLSLRRRGRKFRRIRRAGSPPGIGTKASSSEPQTARNRSRCNSPRRIDPCLSEPSCASRTCATVDPSSYGSTTAGLTFTSGLSTCHTRPPRTSAFWTMVWRRSALPFTNRINAMLPRIRSCALGRQPPFGRLEIPSRQSESEAPNRPCLRDRAARRATTQPRETSPLQSRSIRCRYSSTTAMD
jgi:hypothetical protein